MQTSGGRLANRRAEYIPSVGILSGTPGRKAGGWEPLGARPIQAFARSSAALAAAQRPSHYRRMQVPSDAPANSANAFVHVQEDVPQAHVRPATRSAAGLQKAPPGPIPNATSRRLAQHRSPWRSSVAPSARPGAAVCRFASRLRDSPGAQRLATDRVLGQSWL